MKRTLQYLTLGVFAAACAAGVASAADYLSVAKDGVNLRSGPSTTSEVLYQLPAGYPLQVMSKEGEWYKVSDHEGDKGYIQSSVVNTTSHVIVKAKECNVRSGPSTNDPVVGKSVQNVIFVKVEQKGAWVKVSHPDLTGWVHKDLVWP